MATLHLPYGGSVADRDMNCSHWRKLSKNIPKRPAGAAADRGNLLHDAMEDHYEHGAAFEDMVGKLTFQDQVLSAEHLPELNRAKQAMETILDKYKIVDYTCEPFVQLVPGEVGGSIDFLGCSEDQKTAAIIDYKFGDGLVFANTPQLAFYAMCAAEDFLTRYFLDKAEKIVLAIVQPANPKGFDLIETTREEVESFKQQYLKALTTDQINIGKHCKFCPAMAFCPEHKRVALSATVLNPEKTTTLTKALDLVEILKPWIKQVEATALDYMKDGARIEGYKLVNANTRPRWNEKAEGVLTRVIGDKAYRERELITITEARKIAKDVDFSAIIEKPVGEPAIAPVTDERVEVIITMPDRLKQLKKA